MQNYGILLNENNIKLHRQYFNQMIKLIGIEVLYRSPKEGKMWTTYSELDANYNPPIITGCIFDEHPDQKTMKKSGWVSELQENSSLIHVPYDLENIQVGSLFIIPGGIDKSLGRLFKVVSMQTIALYPASITCEIVPEYETTFEKASHNFTQTSFNLLKEEEDNL